MKTSVKDMFQGTLHRISDFWSQQSKKRKALILSIISGAVVIAVVVAAALNHVNYVTLYSGLDLTEAGEITAKLDDMKVKYKTVGDSTILVPDSQAAKLKMTLATDGYPKSTLNYDLFSSKSGFMTTDYEKRQYLIFQLQDRLQASIDTIEGIKSSIVTISLPENDSFVLKEDEIPVTASVVLEMDGNASLDKQQVKGIETLVATGVPGLKTKNVSIVDNTGDILSNQYSDDAVGQSSSKLDIESNISTLMEGRITKLFSPIFGAGGFRVAVNTLVDTNQKTSEKTTYSPVRGQKGGIISQQQTNQQTTTNQTGASGIPGTGSNTSSGATAGTSSSDQVPTYPEVAKGSGNTDQNQSTSTDYLVDQIKEQVNGNGYEIKDISAAILIGQNVDQSQINEYQKMVAFAMGIPPDRVSISTAQFADSNKVKEAQSNAVSGNPSPLLLWGILLLLGLLVLLLLLFIGSRHRKKPEENAYPTDTTDQPKLEDMFGKQKMGEQIPGEIVLNETREQALKRQLKDFSSSNPEIIAQLLRTWLKEDGDENGY